MKTIIHPPHYIAWSIDGVDTSGPFQRRWLLQQTLVHGTAEDIRRLDFAEVERELDQLILPPDIESLWRLYFDSRRQARALAREADGRLAS